MKDQVDEAALFLEQTRKKAHADITLKAFEFGKECVRVEDIYFVRVKRAAKTNLQTLQFKTFGQVRQFDFDAIFKFQEFQFGMENLQDCFSISRRDFFQTNGGYLGKTKVYNSQ